MQSDCYTLINEAKAKVESVSGPFKVECIFCPQQEPVTEQMMEDYAKKYSDLFYKGFHCEDPEHIEKAHAVSKCYWNCCGNSVKRQLVEESITVPRKIE